MQIELCFQLVKRAIILLIGQVFYANCKVCDLHKLDVHNVLLSFDCSCKPHNVDGPENANSSVAANDDVGERGSIHLAIVVQVDR